jgi:molybdopterin-binding protein
MIKALLGPNGAGKSTYLRKLMGLETGGIDRTMTMVFQEPLLFDLTVFENVALGLRFRRDKNINEKTNRWLDNLGITHLKSRRALTLSGGEAQKVALARAFVLEPKVLLLDEPFANLDLPAQLELRAKLKKIIQDNKVETIWVTHNKTEALEIADHLLIMINRKIVQEGSAEKVVQNPATEEIAGFLGIENIFHGRITMHDGRGFFENDQIRFEVAAEEKADAWVVVHPEDIIISEQPLVNTSARNTLPGMVSDVAKNGLIKRVVINAGEEFRVNITRASADELMLKSGKKVFLTFKATAVHVI